MRSLTASERSALIRLASTLPKGSKERKALVATLTLASDLSASDLSAPEDAGTMRGARKWTDFIAQVARSHPPGPARMAVINNAQKELGYAKFLWRKNRKLVSFYDDFIRELLLTRDVDYSE